MGWLFQRITHQVNLIGFFSQDKPLEQILTHKNPGNIIYFLHRIKVSKQKNHTLVQEKGHAKSRLSQLHYNPITMQISYCKLYTKKKYYYLNKLRNKNKVQDQF